MLLSQLAQQADDSTLVEVTIETSSWLTAYQVTLPLITAAIGWGFAVWRMKRDARLRAEDRNQARESRELSRAESQATERLDDAGVKIERLTAAVGTCAYFADMLTAEQELQTRDLPALSDGVALPSELIETYGATARQLVDADLSDGPTRDELIGTLRGLEASLALELHRSWTLQGELAAHHADLTAQAELRRRASES